MTISVPRSCILVALLLCQETVGSVLPVPVAIYPLNAKFTVKDGSCYGSEAGRQVGVKLAAGPYNKAETAFEFMGTRQSYIEIPASQQLDTRYSMTVLAWVYYNGPSSGPIFSYVEKRGLGVQLWVMRQGRLFARLMERDGRLNDIVTLENDEVNFTGNWYYVGVSFDHSSRRATLWIDGQSVQERITLDKLELKTGGKMRLGSVSTKHTKHFKGKISCIQIYNKALSHNEVKAVKDRCLLDGEDPVNCRTVTFNGTCREHITKKSGTFYSPGYPRGYPANINCVWTIHTKTNQPVKLKFKVFSLEDNPSECSDYVEIKDGLGSWDLPLRKFCGGAKVGQDWIEATSDSMRVEFATNGYVGGLGFIAQYNSSDIVEGNPDLSFHYTAIVIGVACAALFSVLTMLLVSRTRRLWRRHQRGSPEHDLSSESDRNSPDIVELAAPPSYAAVMRSPELYPPSPRVTPAHSRCGTPVLRPKLGPLSSTPVASRISLATTLSSARHSQCAITDVNCEDDEEPPPYPGIVVPPCLYSRQSSFPLTISHSLRGISPLLYSGVRRKSQGDLDRSLDRYSRNQGRPVSSLGNSRDASMRPSSFSRRPSPLITSCHLHSNRSLPGCTGGSRQACSTWSRQGHQLTDRCLGHPCLNEQRDNHLNHNRDGEGRCPTEQQLKQNQLYNSEDCQEQRELSGNSSCFDVYYDEDPPPYPETESQLCYESVTQGESTSSNNLTTVITDDSLASGGQIKTNTPMKHYDNHSDAVNGDAPQLQDRTSINNNLASDNNLGSSCRQATTEHEDHHPEDSRPATSLQQQQNVNICNSSKNVTSKDFDVVDSPTEHNNENNSYDSPWQRRLSPARRRQRALHRAAGERPDSVTSTGPHLLKQNANETEESSVLPGQATAT